MFVRIAAGTEPELNVSPPAIGCVLSASIQIDLVDCAIIGSDSSKRFGRSYTSRA